MHPVSGQVMYEFCGFPGSRPRAFEVTIDWEPGIDSYHVPNRRPARACFPPIWLPRLRVKRTARARGFQFFLLLFFVFFSLSLFVSPPPLSLSLFLSLSVSRLVHTLRCANARVKSARCATGGAERFDRQVARLDLLAASLAPPNKFHYAIIPDHARLSLYPSSFHVTAILLSTVSSDFSAHYFRLSLSISHIFLHSIVNYIINYTVSYIELYSKLYRTLWNFLETKALANCDWYWRKMSGITIASFYRQLLNFLSTVFFLLLVPRNRERQRERERER